MDFNTVWDNTNKIWALATLSKEEGQLYFDLLKTVPEGGVVVELGLHFGRSFSIIRQLSQEKNFRVYGVDSFEHGGVIEGKEIPGKAVKQYFFDHNRDFKFHLYEEKTNTAVRKFRKLKRKIDFLLVDAGHSYEDVRDDLNKWVPLVKDGGYIFCHDYYRDSLDGVTKAVDEFLETNDLHVVNPTREPYNSFLVLQKI